MIVGYYPGWDRGHVREYLYGLANDGQRKRAASKLDFDVQVLATTWPRPQWVTAKLMKGYEPLWELSREYQGVAYRIFFCVLGGELWLLHA